MERDRSPVCGFEVATFYHAADIGESGGRLLIGGDFYEVTALNSRFVTLAVGDVCGHGLAAAAQAVKIKATLQVLCQENSTPSGGLALLNNIRPRKPMGVPTGGGTKAEMGFDRFTALCLAVADGATGALRFASAGIEGALILRKQGGSELLPCDGLVLGILPNLRYEEREYRLTPGDFLVLMTDGITEARKANGEMLGIENVQILLNDLRQSCGDPYQLGQRVMSSVLDYCGGKPADDICLLIAEWRGGLD